MKRNITTLHFVYISCFKSKCIDSQQSGGTILNKKPNERNFISAVKLYASFVSVFCLYRIISPRSRRSGSYVILCVQSGVMNLAIPPVAMRVAGSPSSAVMRSIRPSKHCGIAEHDTVSHTFDGVLSNRTFRNIEADPRKLGCIGNEGV